MRDAELLVTHEALEGEEGLAKEGLDHIGITEVFCVESEHVYGVLDLVLPKDA